MSSPPEPAIRRRERVRRMAAWIPTFVGGALLTLVFYSPVTTVMDSHLDPSNYASYTYFATHQFQYGPEVVPMAGPYGYVMYGAVYNGLLYWQRLIAQLACAAAFAALILWFFRQCRGSSWRWLWLGLLVLLSPVIEDLPFEWTILLAGLFLLQRGPPVPAVRWAVLISTLLAFVSLIKGTHLILSVATLTVVVGYHLWMRDPRQVARIAGSYAGAFLLFWLLAGQDPRHIPSFLQGIRALTNGYNEAMAINETRGILLRGLLAFVLLVGAYGWGFWHRRRNPAILAATLLFLGFTFVKWKHGFVRADGHSFIFHHYTAVAAIAWFLVVFALHRQPEAARTRRVAVVLMLAGVLVGVWVESLRIAALRLHWLSTRWTPDRIEVSLAQLGSPRAAKARLDERMAEQREIYVMPLTRQEVGDRPIDLFGVQHGIIPLNELNYRPRPMGGGGFNVYNPYLTALNRDFLRDAARRPDYYLLRFETIDNRLAAQDDGPALLELLHHYRPILIEREHVLMEEMEDPSPAELRFHSRRTFAFSEFVPVPRGDDDQLLVARFDIRLNARGRLRSALYKAPLMFMTLQGENIENPESRRFIPSMASSPFLFSPVVENNSDVLKLYTRRPGKALTGFFIYSHGPSFYKEELVVEFHTLPRPPEPAAPTVDELLTSARFPVFNLPPESVEAENARQMHLGSLLVQTLHAPGEIRWKLDGTEEELIFDYGLMPEASAQGTGNGVVFAVELQPPGQAAQVLFEQWLDPANHPSHRANQTARVTLPAIPPGSRLGLRTDPGPGGDSAWDWSYVTRVQIKRGYFPSERFPVFNREPIAVEPADAGPLDVPEGKVFLLHLPGTMTFELAGKEQRLHLEFGFLPGAYTGEGRTDGADFIVEWIRPGQPPRELFRRTLRPVDLSADRGTHAADVALPAVAEGDTLVVRTDPVPGGGNSWGWTYFSRLTID